MRATILPGVCLVASLVLGVSAVVWAIAVPSTLTGCNYRVGNSIRLTPKGQFFMHPSWSPDGRWVAVTKAKYRGIYVIDPAVGSGSFRELADEPGSGYGFLWSKDARHITYRISGGWASVDVSTGRRGAVTGMRPNGTREETLAQVRGAKFAYLDSLRHPWFREDGKSRLVADDGTYLLPTLSPDGNRVLARKVGGNMFVFDVSDTSRPPVRADLGPGVPGSWSPDGRRVLFNVERDDGHDIVSSELFVIGSDGTGKCQLTFTSAVHELHPQWSPDGKSIAYDDCASGGVFVAGLEWTE